LYLGIFSLLPRLMPGKETRKLAAVMFADITGYTAMVQENETEALAKVDIHRNALQRFTHQHGGEVIAFYGDGSLSTYPSAIDAVKCAMEMQKVYAERDVPVRIGLHLGDIVFKEGTVFGDGVNLASRIEAQGIPGAILISAKLQEEIANHPEILTKSLGHHSLKNVNEPIELFAIANEGLNIPAGKRQYAKSWRTLTRIGIVLTILLLLGYIVYDIGILRPNAALKQEKIAVRFMNFANVEGTEQLADMASHWISNRIEEIPGSKVVKFESANTDRALQMATAGSKQRRKFASETGAANLLEGQIFKEGDSLVFDAKIIDLAEGSIRQKFGPIRCTLSNPMLGIDEITNEIRGWWASKDLKFVSVPKYDAYKAYLAARSVWLRDRDLAEKKLREAIAADPTFLDPYFLLLGHFQNEDRYPERDTLLMQIQQNFTDMNARQMNLLELASADAAGDLRTTFSKLLNEIKVDSLDFFSNTEAMVMSMYYVNDPKTAARFFHMIPLDSLELHDCGYCITRLRTAVAAFLETDSIAQAQDILEHIGETSYLSVKRKIQVYTKSGDSTLLRHLIANAIQNKVNRSSFFWTVAAWHYKLLGNDAGFEVALKTAAAEGANHNEFSMAEISYLLGDYNEISKRVDAWLVKYPANRYILSFAARVRARVGNQKEIESLIQVLNNADEKDKYDYGFYTYYLGVIEAIQGNQDAALDLLEKAYDQGHRFQDIYYDHDIDLIPLFDHPRFQKLLHPLAERAL
jgi:class 3 adenylate cyclase/TolB-like protein